MTQTGTTAVVSTANKVAQVKPPKKIDILKSTLNAPSVMAQFQNALNKNASTFVASIIDLYNSDSKLQLCEPKQVVMEALKAATLHLPINRSLGYAYIIPFNNNKKVQYTDEKGQLKERWEKVMEPTFQMGYKGYIQLAMRTGQYKTINADVVYEGELKKTNKLTGEISFDGEKTSDVVIGYFCYFELLNGFSKTLYMTVEEVARHGKKYSKAIKGDNKVTVESLMKLASLPVTSDTTAVGWLGNFHSMAVKTVIRNLLGKYGYLSVEIQNAMIDDENGDSAVNETKSADRETVDMTEVSYEEVAPAAEQGPQNEIEPGY